MHANTPAPSAVHPSVPLPIELPELNPTQLPTWPLVHTNVVPVQLQHSPLLDPPDDDDDPPPDDELPLDDDDPLLEPLLDDPPLDDLPPDDELPPLLLLEEEL